MGKISRKAGSAVCCGDLLRPIEEIVGCSHTLWPDGAFVNGSADTSVGGVLLTWMADVPALEKAVASGCDVVLCHESVFFGEKWELPPYRWLAKDYQIDEPPWHPNTRRRSLIQDKDLTVVQCHYGMDRFPIYDSFREALCLGKTKAGDGWESVYALKRRMTLAELAEYVKRQLGISGMLRVAGRLDAKVSSVALLWGGLGLSVNIYWMRRAMENGAESVICGECCEAAMNYGNEIGMPMIETSHRLSEEIGIAKYAEVLHQRFPRLKVVTHLSGSPFSTL